MTRAPHLQRLVQTTAILIPVLSAIAWFYKNATWELEAAVADAFAWLVWSSLFHVPLYFALSAQSRSWRLRMPTAGLLTVVAGFFGYLFGVGIMQLDVWRNDAGAVAQGAWYLLILTSLYVHLVAIIALLRPTRAEQPAVPVV